MKKTFICCAALAAAFSLLLCACGTPAGPAVATTAADLSAFVTAFDLSDLSQYLTEPQLAAVEAAVRETLTSRGHAPESFTLQFDDPTEDSLKLPFDNAGGLDLARLDTAKLAGYIADQMETALGVLGTAPATSAVVKTTTTTVTVKPAATTQAPTTIKPITTNTTTTAKPTTTKSKQQMYPQELRLTSNQMIDASSYSDPAKFKGISKSFSECADNGFNLVFTDKKGNTYLFTRNAAYNSAAYIDNQFKTGAVETVGFYIKTGQAGNQSIFKLLTTADYTVAEPGGSPPGYKVRIIPDLNDTWPGTSGTMYQGI